MVGALAETVYVSYDVFQIYLINIISFLVMSISFQLSVSLTDNRIIIRSVSLPSLRQIRRMEAETGEWWLRPAPELDIKYWPRVSKRFLCSFVDFRVHKHFIWKKIYVLKCCLSQRSLFSESPLPCKSLGTQLTHMEIENHVILRRSYTFKLAIAPWLRFAL